MRGTVALRGHRGRRVAAVVPAVLVAVATGLPAAVPVCENVPEHGFRLRLEAQDPRPSLAEVPREVREREYGMPVPERVSGHPYSFWDFVPPGFFPAVGVSKADVETLDNAAWRRNIELFRTLRREAVARRAPWALNISYRTIDWLYAVARSPEFFSQWEFENDGGVRGLEISPDETWNAGRYETEGMNLGRMWMMIAALYVANHPKARPWIDEFPDEIHVPDGYWQRFPDPDPGQGWNLARERDRIREYLCSDPELKYKAFQAQEYFLKHDDPRIRAMGRTQIDNVDAYIRKLIADFESVFAVLAPGTSSRDEFLTLVGMEEASDRTRMLHTMDNRGAAKTYIAVMDRSRDAVHRMGGSTSVVAVWEAMRWSEKYLWPDPCLEHLKFPAFSDRVTENAVAGAASAASCRATAWLMDAWDRESVYRAAMRRRASGG